MIALTFDDGPNPKTTPQILSILNKLGIKATFFIVGANAQKYPSLLKQIARENHQVETHSFDHSPALFVSSPQKIEKDLKKTKEIIQKITGKTPTFFRPPWGITTPWMKKAAAKLNLTVIKWTIDSKDSWLFPKPNAVKIASNVLQKLEDSAIILLHDGNGTAQTERKETALALPLIIEGAKKSGFAFATLSDTLQKT